jgi:hypothetical protein
MRQYISYSEASRKPVIQLGGQYILIEFGICMKPVRLIRMCLNETYSNKVHIGKHLNDMFLFKMV